MTKQLFTVDVEESFHAAALEPFVPRNRWAQVSSRVERGVDRLLELLARHGATGTFFTLGLVAERTPDVVRRIVAGGHEVASHGWSHRRVNQMTPHEFRGEVVRSRDLLADLSGQPVLGFRAPNFSILAGCEWAFDILLEEGFVYDSSIFPSRRSGAGFESHVQSFQRSGGNLLEFPMTAASVGSLRIPAGGGAWFRLLPYSLTRRALLQAADREIPGMFYIHPWELDLDQPRVPVDVLTRLRHYGGLNRMIPRVDRLMSEFHFTSIAGWLAAKRQMVAA